jgi:hypothetical protein
MFIPLKQLVSLHLQGFWLISGYFLADEFDKMMRKSLWIKGFIVVQQALFTFQKSEVE